MKGINRSIIGSIIIILIITCIVVFTGEEEKVANVGTMNNTKNRPVMNQEMPVNDEQNNQPIVQADDTMQPPMNMKGAPEGALEACQGLNEGDACSYKSGNEVCKYMQDQLACVPERMN